MYKYVAIGYAYPSIEGCACSIMIRSMARHDLSIIAALKEDRRNGASIMALMKKYGLAKTTVWHHVKGISLSKSQIKLLRSNGGLVRGQRRQEVANARAEPLIAAMSEESIWPAVFASLYWSEGTKKNEFVFTNTDELMMRVMLHILRKHLGLHNDDFKILIRVTRSHNQQQCRKYWAKVLELPIDQVRVDMNDKQNSSKKQYGVCRLTLRRGSNYLRLAHCLIQGLAVKMLHPSP